MKKLLGILGIAIIGGIVALGLSKAFSDEKPQTFQERQEARFTKAERIENFNGFDFVAVSKMATPTVVHITTTLSASRTQGQGQELFDPFNFFDERMQQPRQAQASGSGVIITDDGFIATNNHVIENAERIEVVLDDKRSYTAELVGRDPETDLALLKIDEKALPFLKFGNSDQLEIGSWVVAVGNPFNLTSTVTAGIVSAKGRNINLLRQKGGDYAVENFIQTDAAVNPGNSGGALVNTNGDLIGINTAIASRTGSYAGYSFAIPINLAKKILDDLLKFGEVKRAILGVRIQDITADLAEEKGLDAIKGVYIPAIVEGGAADKGGIKEGDVLTHINKIEVNKASDLQEQISKYHPGDEVEIGLIRNSKSMLVSVVLRSKEGATEISETPAKEVVSILGAEFENLNYEERLKLKLNGGVRITKLKEGILKDKGVEKGFIITKMNGKSIRSTEDVKAVVNNANGTLLIEGRDEEGKKEAYAMIIDKN